jgi:hypothetical protein
MTVVDPAAAAAAAVVEGLLLVSNHPVIPFFYSLRPCCQPLDGEWYQLLPMPAVDLVDSPNSIFEPNATHCLLPYSVMVIASHHYYYYRSPTIVLAVENDVAVIYMEGMRLLCVLLLSASLWLATMISFRGDGD